MFFFKYFLNIACIYVLQIQMLYQTILLHVLKGLKNFVLSNNYENEIKHRQRIKKMVNGIEIQNDEWY